MVIGDSDLRPNLEADLDRRALSAWRDLRALSRVPGERPPADRAQWPAWARGEATAGPRYDGIVLAELRERWAARRLPVVIEPQPIGSVAPWREFVKYGRWLWGRAAIRRGYTHIEPVVWIEPQYGGHRASWAAWRIPGLVALPCVGRTVEEVRASVDAALRGQRVTL